MFVQKHFENLHLIRLSILKDENVLRELIRMICGKFYFSVVFVQNFVDFVVKTIRVILGLCELSC